MAKAGRLWFDEDNTSYLHEQLMEALRKPEPEGVETSAGKSKGWIIRDPWRGDHVVDAFILAVWTVFMDQVELPESLSTPGNPFEEAQRGLDFSRAQNEKRELMGFNKSQGSLTEDEEMFSSYFGRKRRTTGFLPPGSFWPDES